MTGTMTNDYGHATQSKFNSGESSKAESPIVKRSRSPVLVDEAENDGTLENGGELINLRGLIHKKKNEV